MKIINTVIIPYLTYGFEGIDVPVTKVTEWQRMIDKVVHRKGGLPFFAVVT